MVTAQGVDEDAGSVHGRDGRDGQLRCLAAELDGVTVRVAAMRARRDDVIHQTALQQVDDVGARAAHLAHYAAGHHLAVQEPGGTGRAVDLVAVVVQLPGKLGGLGLVAVLDRDDDAGAGAGCLELVSSRDQALHHGLVEGGRNAQDLTGGLHLGAEHRVNAVQL